jgi:hypothetical protein
MTSGYIDLDGTGSREPTTEEVKAVAKALMESPGVHKPAMFPVGCRATYNYRRNITTDALPIYISKSRHVLPYGAVEVAPVYVGGYGFLAEVETAGFAGVNIGLAPVWGAPAGNIYDVNAIKRLTRRGKFSMTIPAGEISQCDPVGINVSAGGAIGLQLFAPSAPDATPLSGSRETARAKTWGEELGKQVAAGSSNLSLSQSGWPANDTASRACLAPAIILGRCADGLRRSSVAIIGHSIPYGQVSGGGFLSRDTGDDDGNSGWIERTLASTRPFTAFTIPGDELRNWMGVNNGSPIAANYATQRFALLSMGFTDAIVQLEVNDFGSITVDQYQEIFKSFVRMLVGFSIRVHVCTPFPQANSTDGWTTSGLQTKTTLSDMIVDWAARLRTNAILWGCASVIDVNAVLRDPIDLWKWNTAPALLSAVGSGLTLDNTHPVQGLNSWLASNPVFNVSTLIPEFPA